MLRLLRIAHISGGIPIFAAYQMSWFLFKTNGVQTNKQMTIAWIIILDNVWCKSTKNDNVDMDTYITLKSSKYAKYKNDEMILCWWCLSKPQWNLFRKQFHLRSWLWLILFSLSKNFSRKICFYEFAMVQKGQVQIIVCERASATKKHIFSSSRKEMIKSHWISKCRGNQCAWDEIWVEVRKKMFLDIIRKGIKL